jgi:hypothetical protein
MLPEVGRRSIQVDEWTTALVFSFVRTNDLSYPSR